MPIPDYRGGSLVNLMASLQAGLGGGEHGYAPLSALSPEEVRAHRRVLLLVIDGLGYDYLRRQPEAWWLNSHLRAAITSVYPPTTATAITTLLTGEAPQQHALTGWFIRFAEFGEVYAVLPGHPRGAAGATLATRAGDLGRFFGRTPFTHRIDLPSDIVTPAEIATSPFNLAYLGAAQLHSYRGLDQLMGVCVRLLRAPGLGYVYAYWPGLDTIGHASGIEGEAACQHLLELDAAIDRLCREARHSDALLLVTADHGQIDTRPEDRLDLADYPGIVDCLSCPLSGEPRTVYCHVKPDQRDRFAQQVQTHLGEVVLMRRAEELIAAEWFGLGAPNPRLRERLGDYVLLLRDGYALYQRLPGESPHVQVGVHGGMTQAELRVPLAIASL